MIRCIMRDMSVLIGGIEVRSSARALPLRKTLSGPNVLDLDTEGL